MIPATASSPRRACRLLGGAALALFMVSAFTPAANLLAAWLAGASVVAPAEAIVVLGAGGGTLDDGLPDSASLRRALRGILLYRAGLARRLVFSGSAGEIEGRVELARELGVPSDAVLRAPGSYTTRDEAARLRVLLGPERIRVEPRIPGRYEMHVGPAVKLLSLVDSRFWIREGLAPSGTDDRIGELWEGTDNQTLGEGQGLELTVFATALRTRRLRSAARRRGRHRARQPVAGGAARVGPRRLPRAPRTTLLPGRGIPLTARPA